MPESYREQGVCGACEEQNFNFTYVYPIGPVCGCPVQGIRVEAGKRTVFHGCRFVGCTFVGFTQEDLMTICSDCYIQDCRIESESVRARKDGAKEP